MSGLVTKIGAVVFAAYMAAAPEVMATVNPNKLSDAPPPVDVSVAALSPEANLVAQTQHEYAEQPAHKPKAWEGMKVNDNLPPLTVEHFNTSTFERNQHLDKPQADIINDQLMGHHCFDAKPDSVELSHAEHTKTPRTNAAYFANLAASEQSQEVEDPYKGCNHLGYAGKYQLGSMAMADAGLYKPSSSKIMWDGEWTDSAKKLGVENIYDYLNSPEVQEFAVRAYTAGNLQALSDRQLLYYATQNFEVTGLKISKQHKDETLPLDESVKVTFAGMLKVAQLVGAHASLPVFNADAKNVNIKERTMNLTNSADGIGTTTLGYLKSAQDVQMDIHYSTKEGKLQWTGIRVQAPKVVEQQKAQDEVQDPEKTPNLSERPPEGVKVANAEIQQVLERGREH